MSKDNPKLKESVNSLSCLVLGGTEGDTQEWKQMIPRELYKKGGQYEGNKICDLVRLIRNKVRLTKTFSFIRAAMEPPWGHLGEVPIPVTWVLY